MATCEDYATAYREAITELTERIQGAEALKRLYNLAQYLWERKAAIRELICRSPDQDEAAIRLCDFAEKIVRSRKGAIAP